MLRINNAMLSGLMPGAFLGPHDRGGPSGPGIFPNDDTTALTGKPAPTAARTPRPDEGSATFVDEARAIGVNTHTSRGIFTISGEGRILNFGPTVLLTVTEAAHDRVRVAINPHSIATGILLVKHTILYDNREGMIYADNDSSMPTLDTGETAVLHQHDMLLLVVKNTEIYRVAVTSHDPTTGNRKVELRMLSDIEFADTIEFAETKRLSKTTTPILSIEQIPIHYDKPIVIGSAGRFNIVGEHILDLQPNHLQFYQQVSGNNVFYWAKDLTNTGQSWVTNEYGFFVALDSTRDTQVFMGHSEIRAGRTLFQTRVSGLIHEWDNTNARSVEITRNGTTIDVHQVPYVQAQPVGNGNFQALVMLTPEDSVQVEIQNITYPTGANLSSGPHWIRNDDIIKITSPEGEVRNFIFKVNPRTYEHSFEELRTTQHNQDGESTIKLTDAGNATFIDEGDTARVNAVTPLSAQEALENARAKKGAATAPLRAAGQAQRPGAFTPAAPRQPTMPPTRAPLGDLHDEAPTSLTGHHSPAAPAEVPAYFGAGQNAEPTKMLTLPKDPKSIRWYDIITLGISYWWRNRSR